MWMKYEQAFYYILFFDFFVNCHNVLLYNKLLLWTCNWQKRCVLNFHNKQISIKINLTSSGRTVSTSNKNDIWCGFPPNLQDKKKKNTKKNNLKEKLCQRNEKQNNFLLSLLPFSRGRFIVKLTYFWIRSREASFQEAICRARSARAKLNYRGKQNIVSVTYMYL